MKCLLPLALLGTLALLAPATEPTKAEAIGFGTILAYDAGYYPQKCSPWVSVPKKLTVIGYYRPNPSLLVCVDQDDAPPYDEFFLVRKDLKWKGDGAKPKVLKLKRGELSPMDDSDVSVPIRE